MFAVFGVRNAQTESQRRFENAVFDNLKDHHGLVTEHERKRLLEMGHEYLTCPLDPTPHLEDVLDDLVTVCRDVGPIQTADGRTVDVAAHFERPEVREQLRLLIGRRFATAMDIERSYYADGNPYHPTVKAWVHGRQEYGGAHAHHHAKAAHEKATAN